MHIFKISSKIYANFKSLTRKIGLLVKHTKRQMDQTLKMCEKEKTLTFLHGDCMLFHMILCFALFFLYLSVFLKY